MRYPSSYACNQFNPSRIRAILTVTVANAALGMAVLAGPMSSEKAPLVEVEPAAHPMYPGTINTGFKGNDEYVDGNFSLVVPVWSTLGAEATLSGDLIYLEPYTSWGEGGEVAASLGLGWRHLFGSQPVSALSHSSPSQPGLLEEGLFVGANVFVDMLDTEADNQFWQLGVGLEVGTRYLEVRGNYYIPLSDRQLAEEYRVRESYQRSSTRLSTEERYGGPFATGNTIQQDAFLTTRATTTTRTTTIDRLFRRYEEGMEGWDAEVAVLLPWVDRWMDVKLIGGYYSFDNQPFGPQVGGAGSVEGWKTGLEVRPVPAVILSGTWYEDDRLTGSDWTAGIQLQIPFEAGDLGDGKGFWSRIGDSFRPRRRHLAERLAEPVHRQNAAIKVANSVEKEKETTTTSMRKRTRVVSQSRERVVLAEDIVFVNNGGAVGNGIADGTAEGDGTAEKPLQTIQEGAAIASSKFNDTDRIWTVYTQGGGPDYTGTVTPTAGVAFHGSGVPLVGNNPSNSIDVPYIGQVPFPISPYTGLGGKTFGGGVSPVLAGQFTAVDLPYLSITGFEIHADVGVNAIEATNVSSLVVVRNTVRGGNSGVGAIWGTEGSPSAFGSAVIVQNTFEDNNYGVRLETYWDASAINFVLENTFTDIGQDGIYLSSAGSTMGNVVGNNTLTNVFQHGIYVQSFLDSFQTTLISGNTITSSGWEGVAIFSDGDSTLLAQLEKNVITDAGDSGIDIRSLSTGDITVNLLDNEIHMPTNHGVYAQNFGEGLIDLEVKSNLISGALGSGMIFKNTDFDGLLSAGDIDVSLNDNTLINLGGRGITFTVVAAGGGTITSSGSTSNTLSLIAGEFIFVSDEAVDGSLIVNDVVLNPPTTQVTVP